MGRTLATGLDYAVGGIVAAVAYLWLFFFILGSVILVLGPFVWLTIHVIDASV